MWMPCAFKKVTNSVPLNTKKKKRKRVKYHHLLSIATTGNDCHILWFENVFSELYCFLIEEDQNKSSANLFSGLRSGGWCNETQLSYLLYHSKNTPGDFDNWIAVKWYPFTIFLNIYESTLFFSQEKNKKKKPVTSRCNARIWKENPTSIFYHSNPSPN